MNITHYIGFDVHKKWIFYCIKAQEGTVIGEGKIAAQRDAVRAWAQQRSEPWMGGLEATPCHPIIACNRIVRPFLRRAEHPEIGCLVCRRAC